MVDTKRRAGAKLVRAGEIRYISVAVDQNAQGRMMSEM